MKVEFDKVHPRPAQSIEAFTRDVLMNNGLDGGESVRLEHQGAVLARAMGRLMNILLRKGILTQSEFFDVIDLTWPFTDHTRVVPDEQ